jgi:hypothetical protein
MLQWARSQAEPCPWDEETCAYAAENGHLHVLQWARSQSEPCPEWDSSDEVSDEVSDELSDDLSDEPTDELEEVVVVDDLM